MRQEALEAPFVHEVDDGIRLPLSLRPHLVFNPQLVMAFEVASDDDIEVRAATALRDMCCVVRYFQVLEHSIGSYRVHPYKTTDTSRNPLIDKVATKRVVHSIK